MIHRTVKTSSNAPFKVQCLHLTVSLALSSVTPSLVVLPSSLPVNRPDCHCCWPGPQLRGIEILQITFMFDFMIYDERFYAGLYLHIKCVADLQRFIFIVCLKRNKDIFGQVHISTNHLITSNHQFPVMLMKAVGTLHVALRYLIAIQSEDTSNYNVSIGCYSKTFTDLN